MPLRLSFRHAIAAAATLTALASATSAIAGERGGWRNGSWYADGEAPPAAPADRDVEAPPPYAAPPHRDPRPYPASAHAAQPGREAWLADCRSRVAARDNGVGGAVIGGVVGGVAGNRIAGRGNRAVGTVAGAAVGAVAGSAIDRAEDRGRARDECEAYLDDYYARYAAAGYGGYTAPAGYMQGGYAPAYRYAGAGCCMAPVMMVPAQTQPECTETVEYVYEDVPVQRRTYRPRRTKAVPDKRVKIVPDKRISTK
jgi:hypothetical protein